MNTDPNKNDMNQQNEPTDSKRASDTPPADSAKKGSAWSRAKQNAMPVALALAIIFVSLYTIVNVEKFTGIFSAILSVTAPILIGASMAYLLNPILKLFEFKVFKRIKNKNLVRGLSLLLTYVVAILFVVAFIFLLVPQLIQSIMDFVGKFDGYIENTSNWINNIATEHLGEKYANLVDKEAIITFIKNFFLTSGSLVDGIKEYGTWLFVGVKNLVLAIFISIYILISKERLSAQTKKLATACFTKKSGKRFYRYARLCHRTFSGFFIGKIIDSLIIGLITLVTLLIFRIPYPLLVSTIVCVTNVIPVFGPFIGAIPSFFIIFISDPTKAFIFLILIFLIQQLDGNVIGPKILGDSTGLSSLGVIISIIIMSEYFGVIGMIVGVPIFAVIVAITKEWIEDRLKTKNLPTDTAEYYDDDSLVDPYDVHESVTTKIFKNLSPKLHAIVDRLKHKKENKENKDENEKEQ